MKILQLILLCGLWIGVTIIIILPLILMFTLGAYLAEKLGFEGIWYLLFIFLFYAILICIMVII